MLTENSLEKFLLTDSKPENCKWKVYHDCIKQLRHGGGYEGLKYHDDVDPVQDTLLGRTRKQKEAVNQRKDENIYENSNEKLCGFGIELFTALSENTFSEEDKKVIENSRNLTDYLTFHQKMVAHTFGSFLKSVRELPVRSVADIDDDELRIEFKIFCVRLGQIEKKQDWKSSRDFIKHFLSTKHKLYEGIEIILHITTCAAVKLSTESVLESKVSIFERHFHKGRPLKEPQMVAEMEVATNGPILVEADKILMSAMKNYWKGSRWHFVKKCDIRDYGKDSNVLQRLKKEKSKLSFMVE